MDLTEAHRARFEAKYTVNPDTGCWDWTACKDQLGYGMLALGKGKSSARAHRVAYHFHVGPIRAGLVLDHLCRNRGCCNPAHLEAVTQQVNVDRGAKPVSLGASKCNVCKSTNGYARKTRDGRSWVCRECMKGHKKNYRFRLQAAEAIARCSL